jgi:hypothetical protein
MPVFLHVTKQVSATLTLRLPSRGLVIRAGQSRLDKDTSQEAT